MSMGTLGSLPINAWNGVTPVLAQTAVFMAKAIASSLDGYSAGSFPSVTAADRNTLFRVRIVRSALLD